MFIPYITLIRNSRVQSDKKVNSWNVFLVKCHLSKFKMNHSSILPDPIRTRRRNIFWGLWREILKIFSLYFFAITVYMEKKMEKLGLGLKSNRAKCYIDHSKEKNACAFLGVIHKLQSQFPPSYFKFNLCGQKRVTVLPNVYIYCLKEWVDK